MIPNFRLWDIKGKYYISKMKSQFLFIQDGKIYEDYEIGIMHDLTDNYIVEMGSGIPDIEGNEIFEGDIVRHTHTCKYSNGNTREFVYEYTIHFSINYGAWLLGEYDRLTPKNVKKYSIKKIGNIHE